MTAEEFTNELEQIGSLKYEIFVSKNDIEYANEILERHKGLKNTSQNKIWLIVDENSKFELVIQIINQSIKLFSKSKSFEFQFNAFWDLILNYELSTIKQLSITFIDEIFIQNKYLYFGDYAGDSLVMDLESSEILLLELQTEYVMCRCAKNGNAFLELILNFSKFISKINEFEGLDEDQEFLKDNVQKACIIAGGDDYYNFVSGVVGYYE